MSWGEKTGGVLDSSVFTAWCTHPDVPQVTGRVTALLGSFIVKRIGRTGVCGEPLGQCMVKMEAAARLLGRRPRFTGTETEWSRWSLHARAQRRHSQPECGGPCRFGGSKRRQSKPFELTQRRCCRERAEDVPRHPDDAPTRSSFASVEDGVARQRLRGPETTGGARQRQREPG